MVNYEVVIIGGGQAGITMGYYLKMKKIPFVILEKNERVGDSWRKRYHSLILFTPRSYSSLPGLQMKGPVNEFPTKDDMADYLESYVKQFDIPVMCNTVINQLSKQQNGPFVLETNKGEIRAYQVIIATGAFQKPFIPNIIEKNQDTFQVHSSEYSSPFELPGKDILVVGGGNSGAQIAVELAKDRNVTLAISHKVKFLPLTIAWKSIFHWLEAFGLLFAGIDSRKGKWFKKQSDPIFGKELKALIKNRKIRVNPRVIEVDGQEVIFEDNSKRKFDSIIWSTGFVPSYDWVNIRDVISPEGKPIHTRGVTKVKGLYFIGLPWQYQRGSALVCGVRIDAEYLVPIIISNAY